MWIWFLGQKVPWRRAWQSTPVLWSGEFHDRGAWWATVHSVAKNWTWLKRLSTHTHTHTLTLTNVGYWYSLQTRKKNIVIQTLNLRLFLYSIATCSLVHVPSLLPVPGVSQTEGLMWTLMRIASWGCWWALDEPLNLSASCPNRRKSITFHALLDKSMAMELQLISFACCWEPCTVWLLKLWLYFCWIIKLKVLSVPET